MPSTCRPCPVDGPAGEESDEDESVGLHAVPDGGARLAGAEDAVEEAIGRVAEAERELAEVDASMEALNARRLQLQGEADELRRRLASIEDDVDQVDDELEVAEELRDDARAALEEARRTQAAGRGGAGEAAEEPVRYGRRRAARPQAGLGLAHRRKTTRLLSAVRPRVGA